MTSADLYPLSRPHERWLFSTYASLGGIAMASKALTPAQFEIAIVMVWLSMILAISFLEAWVKFKAPFLRKHVAVDVGRHVFCALNSVELALASLLWSSRRFVAENDATAWSLVLATVCMVTMTFLIAPQLYLRAKFQIVTSLEKDAAANKGSKQRVLLTEHESLVLQRLYLDIAGGTTTMPSPKWHIGYILLEMIKVGGFVTYLAGSL